MFEYKHYKESFDFIRKFVDSEIRKGIILGTGLSELVARIDIDHSIDYSDIPHFPLSTVESHKGKLIFGQLEGQDVVVMQGRFHFYEGYSMEEVAFGVRIMKLLGVSDLFISNVSGSLNPEYNIGDIMIIEDHINLLPGNPLIGKNLEEFGPRFPDMLNAYSPSLVMKAYEFAKSNNYPVRKGVYVSVMGPNLETPAEYKFLRTIGADAVGMSTIPEVIVARHADINVFGISIITDLGVAGKIKKVNVAEIIEVANNTQPKLTNIITHLLT
ncbi:MAG: purine-nucleoside phosphorylase [Chitinophagales bacterium]|nr:purine-nucleoside phosphorylase [Chitinophagales bacterium]